MKHSAFNCRHRAVSTFFHLTAVMGFMTLMAVTSGCSHLLPASLRKSVPANVRLVNALMKTPIEAELEAPTALQGGASVVKIHLRDETVRVLEVSWRGTEIPALAWKGDPLELRAVFGIPLDSEPGPAEVKIKYELSVKKAEPKVLALPFELLERDVRSERLKVKGKLLGKRRSRALATRAIHPTPSARQPISEALWGDEGFALPTRGRVTSGFGSQRNYNGGQLRSVHLGTDLDANMGDPVLGAAGGKVVSVKRHLQTGNTIVIDHGFGIFTSYAHLSKILVQVGDLIQDGALIGLAGRTGRVTGAHLHWGASIRGVTIDPLTLVQLFRQSL